MGFRLDYTEPHGDGAYKGAYHRISAVHLLWLRKGQCRAYIKLGVWASKKDSDDGLPPRREYTFGLLEEPSYDYPLGHRKGDDLEPGRGRDHPAEPWLPAAGDVFDLKELSRSGQNPVRAAYRFILARKEFAEAKSDVRTSKGTKKAGGRKGKAGK